MCSIIGYVGDVAAAPLILKGLQRMEYRGYDSAGVATFDGNRITVRKGVGKVAQVNASVHLEGLGGTVGIGHTRWATHGGVTEANAHPHLSSTGGVAIVHNGIIDNHDELREMLIGEGYPFRSETDSEVISNLLQWHLDQQMGISESLKGTVGYLRGSYSFAAVFPDGSLGAARFREPLILGIGKEGYFVASDVLGFIEHTDRLVYVDNSELVMINRKGVFLSGFDGTTVGHNVIRVSTEVSDMDKGSFGHHTLKEIFEQPVAILKAGEKSEAEMLKATKLIQNAGRLYITASGTSLNAAMLGKYLFSKYAKLNPEVVIASEATFAPVEFDAGSVVIAVSQSGETADVLEAVNLAKDGGARIVSLVNVMTSTLAHLSDVSIGLNCGPEIGVAATKSFTSELAIFYKLTDALTGGLIGPLLNGASEAFSKVILEHQKIKDVAARLKGVKDIYVLGRGAHFSVASEASLKLKELAYIHAEALPGGELKHGPLALLDSAACVMILNPSDSTFSNTIACAHEVKARGARLIGVSDRRNELFDDWIEVPPVDQRLFPLVEVVPLQLLAYYLALGVQVDPDYPRNLAKSVTVK